MRKKKAVTGQNVCTAKELETLKREAKRMIKEANATNDEQGDQGRGDYDEVMLDRQETF